MASADRCKITVLLVTFNQASFVAEAVESIIKQQIDAPVEIVVADDCSTDGTREIILRVLAKNNWTRVRFLDHGRRRGLMKNYERAFEACTSQYVAVLEGDDYWIRPDKLARQTALLDTHPQCALSATNILITDMATGRTEPRVPSSDEITYLHPPDVIANSTLPGNFSACLYRLEAVRSLPSGLFDLVAADWIVNICASRLGPLAFLHEPMSVYRQHSGGAWSSLSQREKNRWNLSFIEGYDALTDFAFSEHFGKLKAELESAAV